MNNQQAYNAWASQYDTNANKTRDLEAIALRSTLSKFHFDKVLEIGCGTGKNSEWIYKNCNALTAVDYSQEMLAKARGKINSPTVNFIQADITQPWNFTTERFDLVSFSLVLEHIEDLDFIFREATNKSTENAYLYIGELHPFKQYTGSVARFQNEQDQRVELQCFIHHTSEFISQAGKYGFGLVALDEWFDEDDRTTIPRIITLLLQRKG